MPGYLSHLALRVSGARQAVRPRIPSLFESLPGSGSASEPEAGGLRMVDQERAAPPPPAPALRSETQNRSSPQPNLREAAVAAPEPQPAQHEPPDRQAAAIVPAEVTISAPRRAERIFEVVAEEAPMLAPPRHVVNRPEVRSVPPAEETRQAESHASAPPREAEPPRGLRAETQERPSVRTQPKEASAEAPRAVPKAVPDVSVPAIRAALQPPSQAEVRPVPRHLAEVVPGSHEEPSVQVTIGRLIVEAVMPAPAAPLAPRPRATGPRLSLDDYLSQRRSQA